MKHVISLNITVRNSIETSKIKPTLSRVAVECYTDGGIDIEAIKRRVTEPLLTKFAPVRLIFVDVTDLPSFFSARIAENLF